jgi:hypothetical protein
VGVHRLTVIRRNQPRSSTPIERPESTAAPRPFVVKSVRHCGNGPRLTGWIRSWTAPASRPTQLMRIGPAGCGGGRQSEPTAPAGSAPDPSPPMRRGRPARDAGDGTVGSGRRSTAGRTGGWWEGTRPPRTRSMARRSSRSAAGGSWRRSASTISPRRNRPSVLEGWRRRASSKSSSTGAIMSPCAAHMLSAGLLDQIADSSGRLSGTLPS